MKLAQEISRKIPLKIVCLDKFMLNYKPSQHSNAYMSEGREAIDSMSTKYSDIKSLNSNIYDLSTEQ